MDSQQSSEEESPECILKLRKPQKREQDSSEEDGSRDTLVVDDQVRFNNIFDDREVKLLSSKVSPCFHLEM